MLCKLKWYSLTALIATLWLPFFAFPMQQEDAVPASSGNETAPVDGVEAEIDLAFIEFLGQWETYDGEWLGPSELADETFVELIEAMGTLEIEEID